MDDRVLNINAGHAAAGSCADFKTCPAACPNVSKNGIVEQMKE